MTVAIATRLVALVASLVVASILVFVVVNFGAALLSLAVAAAAFRMKQEHGEGGQAQSQGAAAGR